MEAERLCAQAEKQRGDDLSKIAMMLAAGKDNDKDYVRPLGVRLNWYSLALFAVGADIIPQSPPAAAADKSTSKTPQHDQREEERSLQHTEKRCNIPTGSGNPATQNREARTKAMHDKHKGGFNQLWNLSQSWCCEKVLGSAAVPSPTLMFFLSLCPVGCAVPLQVLVVLPQVLGLSPRERARLIVGCCEEVVVAVWWWGWCWAVWQLLSISLSYCLRLQTRPECVVLHLLSAIRAHALSPLSKTTVPR